MYLTDLHYTANIHLTYKRGECITVMIAWYIITTHISWLFIPSIASRLLSTVASWIGCFCRVRTPSSLEEVQWTKLVGNTKDDLPWNSSVYPYHDPSTWRVNGSRPTLLVLQNVFNSALERFEVGVMLLGGCRFRRTTDYFLLMWMEPLHSWGFLLIWQLPSANNTGTCSQYTLHPWPVAYSKFFSSLLRILVNSILELDDIVLKPSCYGPNLIRRAFKQFLYTPYTMLSRPGTGRFHCPQILNMQIILR